MKILLIHNNYGVYSGEETVVNKQIALFREMGHQVSVYRKTTEGLRGTLWGNIKGFFTAFYSWSSVREVKRILKNDKPGIVVVHNLYPYISPAVLKPIHKAGVPIIMTVHNYRLICPTGLFMRNAKPCELCLEKGNEWSCVRYNCEHSLLKSIGYAGRNWYARKTKAYTDNVDTYTCLTDFQKQKLVEAGFDENKITVIPNSIPFSSELNYMPGDYVAYIGRLSYEKGYDLLIEAANEIPEIPFYFAGAKRDIVTKTPQNVQLIGHLNKEALAEFIRNSRFVVMPSRCYEGFPMTILEAAAYAKPTIAPAHAGFLEIIDENETGLHFEPGNVVDLSQKIRYLWKNEVACRQMGEQAFQKLQTHYLFESIKKKWETLLNSHEKITQHHNSLL
ncbi:glycosyl transferase [Bacteroidia bacterium]|nr:glycosyl transferase [Bacteroidia bacterium]